MNEKDYVIKKVSIIFCFIYYSEFGQNVIIH